MPETPAEALARVEEMIATITTGGQEIRRGENFVRLPDLETLLAERNRLAALIERQVRGGMRIRGVTPV